MFCSASAKASSHPNTSLEKLQTKHCYSMNRDALPQWSDTYVADALSAAPTGGGCNFCRF
jgi:hypothetical protein